MQQPSNFYQSQQQAFLLAQQQQQQQHQQQAAAAAAAAAVPPPNDKEDIEDDSDDEGSKPGVKRSGRRKIKIEYIEDKSRRHITFSKRKAGIMKKAYELSTLTGTQVLLLVVSETGLVYTFTTPKLQPLVTKPEGKNLIQSCLNAPDALDGAATADPATSMSRMQKENTRAYGGMAAAAPPPPPSSSSSTSSSFGYPAYLQQDSGASIPR